MKVIINYDPITGSVTDKIGCFVCSWMNLQFEDVADKTTTTEINELIKLKEAGFTVEEITVLRDRGLI